MCGDMRGLAGIWSLVTIDRRTAFTGCHDHRCTRSDSLSVREAAEMLNVAPITVRRKIDAGEILAVQLGGPGSAIRIPRGELDEWLYAEPVR
jgi:excisionase family DNA binding protein